MCLKSIKTKKKTTKKKQRSEHNNMATTKNKTKQKDIEQNSKNKFGFFRII